MTGFPTIGIYKSSGGFTLCDWGHTHPKFVVIEGKRATTIGDLHTELSRAFCFPAYYGRNLNALLDCLRDITASPMVLVVQNSHLLLSEESEDTFCGFVETLQHAIDELSEPVELGEVWDRKAILFQVVFCCQEPDKRLEKFPHWPVSSADYSPISRAR